MKKLTHRYSPRTSSSDKIRNTGKLESAVNWWELVRGRWSHLLIFLSLCVVQGTELFNVSSHNGTHEFTYTAKAWLSEFLNLTLNDTDLYYRMQLDKPLDLEEIYYNLSVADISGFSFTLHCKFQTDSNQDYHIIVEAVNEWAPEFNTTSIQLSVKETQPIKSVVVNLTQWSSDRDVHPISREINAYSFLNYTGDPQVDGHSWLDMLIAYDGIVVVKKELDYETLPQGKKYVLLGVQVTDQGGKTGTASLTVYVEDADDLPPVFTYAGCWQPCRVTYSVSLSPNFTGLVTGIKPAPIEAHDGDTLNYPVEYYIVQGPEHFEHYFDIHNVTGHLFILQDLKATGLSTLVLIVEAREISQNARSTRTTLLISVQDGTQVRPSSTDNEETVIIVSVVLGSVLIIVFVLLIIMVVYIKKRSKTPVFPANSVTTSQGGLDTLSGINHQTQSTTKTKKEIHAQRTGSSTILVSEDYGYADIEPSSPVDRQTAFLLLNTPRSNNTRLFGKSTLEKSPDSETVVAHEGDHEDYLATVSDNQRSIINSNSTSTHIEVVHLSASDKDTEEPKVSTRPTLQILSGLKVPKSSQNSDDPYGTVDRKNKSSREIDISDPDPASLESEIKANPRSGSKRKKSRRKSQKSSQDHDDGIYDGAEIMGNVEFDSGFYTDSTKTRIKRSSRKPVLIPDPNDIKYWLTVQDDY